MKNLIEFTNFQKRFFIIFFLFVSFSVYQIFSDSLSLLYKLEKNHTKKQESFLFIHSISLLTYDIQKLRGLCNIYKRSDKVDKELILQLQNNLNRKFKKVLIYYSYLNLNKELLLILEELDFIKINLDSISSDRLFYKYTLIIDRLMSLVSIISYNYDLDKYMNTVSKIFMEVLISEIPIILENFGKARGITAGNLVLNTSLIEKNSEISFYNKLIHIDIKRINQKLNNVLKFNSEYKKTLRKNISILEKNSLEFIQILNIQKNNNFSNEKNAYDFYISSTKIINEYISIYNNLFITFNKELNTEHERLKNNFYTKIIIEVIFLLIGIVLFILFYTSSLKYINRLKKAEKIKSEFLSNMSHEIRTPLNAIIGFIKLIKENKSDNNEEYINIVENSSEQLLFIINDILDLSKIENNKITLVKESFNTRIEFNLIKDIFLANVLKKDINLNIKIDDLVPEFIMSDKFRLKQIIINLLSNAIKFTNIKGEINLNISMLDDKLCISVEDNGIGIPRNKQKTIFESFSQVDDTITRKYGGTGLGLAICSKLVALFNSKLELESEVNKGSKFFFSISFENSFSIKESLSEDYLNDKYNGKVLLVEDNITNQFLMEITFNNLEINVKIVNDGLEALAAVKESSYDLIFMDENMPNMNGLEATKEIRLYEKNNSLKENIIIALTANAQEDDKNRFIKEGMNEYLSKPLDLKLLHTILSKYLEKKSD